MTGSKQTGHLLALDGARGVAALAVFAYHLTSMTVGAPVLPGAFLAVDLFFLMSGFVVALSYESRLRSGALSFLSFVRVRIIRLYPLYLAACGVGLAYHVSKLVLGTPDAPSLGTLLQPLPQAVLLLPNPASADWASSEYPFAPSAWSLTLELWGTILYAAVAPKLRTWHLAALAVVAAAVLVQQALAFSTVDLGFNLRTFAGGAARFGLSFSMGVLLFRLRDRIMPKQPVPLWAALPAFGFVLLPHEAIWLSLLWVMLVFPLALIALASASYPAAAAKPLDHLGRLSFGVYILHAPAMLFVAAAFKVVLGEAWDDNGSLLAAAAVVAVLGLSAATTYLFDEPVRARLRPRRIAPAALTSGLSSS
ncbi:acyltransferase [Rubellimicrobium rubrum]|uniref:Acyltransferase n=1 Tax=Rubellimicrobium rubrum TaxID=2585369 RepID=A0A5C4MRX7_9RHOB|nr:acyltransferase [Rubellimicrobium rubrum]TNC47712.1 acyltransferase [Rubellimicrobium rubrum]